MVLLSQREYNDLLKRSGNADILAEEKMDKLKGQLRERFISLYDINRHVTDSPDRILKELVSLLNS